MEVRIPHWMVNAGPESVLQTKQQEGMKFSSPKRFRALRTSKGIEFTSGKISTL
jgi:hypothetical protein